MVILGLFTPSGTRADVQGPVKGSTDVPLGAPMTPLCDDTRLASSGAHTGTSVTRLASFGPRVWGRSAFTMARPEPSIGCDSTSAGRGRRCMIVSVVGSENSVVTERLEVRHPLEADRPLFVELFCNEAFMVFSDGVMSEA